MLFPQIEELATTGIVSVREDAPVSVALEQMSRCKLHTIVVEEASGGFGLLTAPDLVRLRFALPSLDIAIRDVGYHRLSCMEKGKNILDVLDAFENGHGYAAVVDGSGALFGIVSNSPPRRAIEWRGSEQVFGAAYTRTKRWTNRPVHTRSGRHSMRPRRGMIGRRCVSCPCGQPDGRPHGTGRRILDVACGTGTVSLACADRASGSTWRR